MLVSYKSFSAVCILLKLPVRLSVYTFAIYQLSIAQNLQRMLLHIECFLCFSYGSYVECYKHVTIHAVYVFLHLIVVSAVCNNCRLFVLSFIHQLNFCQPDFGTDFHFSRQ